MRAPTSAEPTRRFRPCPPRRGNARRTGFRASALVATTAVVLALVPACTTEPQRVSNLHEGWTWQSQSGTLTLGVTHTQHSLNPQDPPAALRRAKRILRSTAGLADQALMGWGALNPEPSPGEFDWSSLDRRMAMIEATGGGATLTLCGAPDWMKGGDPGTTDWSRIEVAPTPSHYRDFAELAATAVRRYPQVHRVIVWNELKGFYDEDAGDWDAAAYTRMYNDVYDAVKKVRPGVRVGGPYAPVDTWSSTDGGHHPSTVSGPWGTVDQRSLDAIEYWLEHKHGADFVVVDGGTGTKDGGVLTAPAIAADKFAVVTNWLQARTPLPVWWAEFYPSVRSGGGPTARASAAATLEALAAFARSGAEAAFLWQPQGDPSFPYAALWTSTSTPAGGRPTPLTEPWEWLLPRLREGGVVVGSADVPAGRDTTVRLLAFRSRDHTLLVNTTGHEISLAAADGTRTLPGWGTVIVSNGSVT